MRPPRQPYQGARAAPAGRGRDAGPQAGRGGLPHPGRAAAGDRLHRRARRARPLALRQPPGRGDPRLHPGGMARRPVAVGEPGPSRGRRAGAGAGDGEDRRDPKPAAARLPHADPRRGGGLDPRRGRPRARRRRHTRLARGSLRHHRAEDRRAGLRAQRRPTGGGRSPRRAGALRGRSCRADGVDRRPRRRDRGGRARLRLGAAPRGAGRLRLRAGLDSASKQGNGRVSGDPQIPRRAAVGVGASRDRRRLGQREPVRHAPGPAGARDPLSASRW